MGFVKKEGFERRYKYRGIDGFKYRIKVKNLFFDVILLIFMYGCVIMLNVKSVLKL